MTEPAVDVVDWLASVRRSGASRLDQARFHTIEAMARRLADLQEPVRSLVERKLQKAAADYASLIETRAPVTKLSKPASAGAAASPLTQLTEHLRAAAAKRSASAAPLAAGDTDDQHELASVRRFRQARERSRSLDQVEEAAARKPVNAGPLNSHALVLESLALMRELSPDYLRRFLLHMETLQWLDQARERQPGPAARRARPATRARSKK